MGLLHMNAGQIQKSASVRNLFGVIVQIGLDLFLLGYLAVQMRVRFQSPFWRTIGWRPLEMDGPSRALIYSGLAFAGIFLQAIVETASSAFAPKRQLPIQAVLEDRHAAILFMMVAVLLAPLVEEIIFRGYNLSRGCAHLRSHRFRRCDGNSFWIASCPSAVGRMVADYAFDIGRRYLHAGARRFEDRGDKFYHPHQL